MAVIAFGLFGLAAAGVASIGSVDLAASPNRLVRATDVTCTPGTVGQAVSKLDILKVKGRAVSGRASVTPGAWVRTDEDGTGKLCLRKARTTCELGSDTRLQVQPKKKRRVLLSEKKRKVLLYVTRADDPLSCAKGDKSRQYIATPHANVTFNDPVFSVSIRKKRTIIKIRRGSAVVARPNRVERGVLLSSGKQVVVRSGRDPEAATAIVVTPAEQRTFHRLSSVGPARDNRAPTKPALTGPSDPTPSTTATFRFRTSESDALFSCALDDEPFRFCRRLHELSRLQPGRHTLRVRAVDPAGNSGKIASYSWTVERPASGPIAFESNRDGDYDIYLVNSDGTGTTQLTNDPAVDVDVSWSPNGRQLAFESSRDGVLSEIYVMNADGSDPTRLTTDPANDRNPKWSPFGDGIAFESNRDGDFELYLMHADGSAVTPLTDNGFTDSDPAWSPDAARIAFQTDRDGNAEIYVMDADGSGPTRLTNNADGDVNPAWSPDGTKIAFESDRDGNHEIYVMNADGSGQTRLTTNGARDSDPVWSPDGSRIAFASDRDGGDFEIYVMNPDGTDQTRVTTSMGVDLVPSW